MSRGPVRGRVRHTTVPLASRRRAGRASVPTRDCRKRVRAVHRVPLARLADTALALMGCSGSEGGVAPQASAAASGAAVIVTVGDSTRPGSAATLRLLPRSTTNRADVTSAARVARPRPWHPATVDVTKQNDDSPSPLPSGVKNFADSPFVVAPQLPRRSAPVRIAAREERRERCVELADIVVERYGTVLRRDRGDVDHMHRHTHQEVDTSRRHRTHRGIDCGGAPLRLIAQQQPGRCRRRARPAATARMVAGVAGITRSAALTISALLSASRYGSRCAMGARATRSH